VRLVQCRANEFYTDSVVAEAKARAEMMTLQKRVGELKEEGKVEEEKANE
jgi:hypothetical protein